MDLASYVASLKVSAVRVHQI